MYDHKRRNSRKRDWLEQREQVRKAQDVSEERLMSGSKGCRRRRQKQLSSPTSEQPINSDVFGR